MATYINKWLVELGSRIAGMFSKFSLKQGFTIVELLIVIVVIGILAAITVVAFNGIQQRAQNNQTVSAVAAWVKALNSYRIDNGAYPPQWACMGSGYKYGPSGTDETGVAQCRQDAAGAGRLEMATFNTAMQPYVKANPPNPAMVTARSSDTLWRRGLSFAPTGGDGTLVYITAAYKGDIACPTIGGVESSTKSLWGGNTACIHVIGHTTDGV